MLGENPRINLGCLSVEESNTLVDRLLERNSGGMGLLEGLISRNRLPNVLIRKPKEFIDFCFSATHGLALLRASIDREVIDLGKFSKGEAEVFRNRLLKHGQLGEELAKKLIEKGKLPCLNTAEETSSKKALDDAMAALEGPYPDVESFGELVLRENSKIDLRRLSPEDSNILANKLLECGPRGMRCLANLIGNSILPNFRPDGWSKEYLTSLIYGGRASIYLLTSLIRKNKVPNFRIHASEEFVDFCCSTGYGLALLQVSINRGVIDLGKFSQKEAEAFRDRLFENDRDGGKLADQLIEEGKLPQFTRLRGMYSGHVLDDAMAALEGHHPDVESFRRLVLGENPTIKLRRLSLENSNILANELLKCGPRGMRCLIDLIDNNKLPSFRPNEWTKEYLTSLIYGGEDSISLLVSLIRKNKVPTFEINASEEFIDFCFSATHGLALLQASIDREVIDLGSGLIRMSLTFWKETEGRTSIKLCG
jgi:hypothetical protein